MEWLVEMTKRIVGDGRVGEVHYHCPSSSEESLALRLGYSCDGIGQLLLTHNALRLVEPLAKSVITVITICASRN